MGISCPLECGYGEVCRVIVALKLRLQMDVAMFKMRPLAGTRGGCGRIGPVRFPTSVFVLDFYITATTSRIPCTT